MLTWMFSRLVGSCAAICVLLLFFFPIIHGPFQATHGPTTAFRARKAFLVLLFSILQAARSVLARMKRVMEVCSLARSAKRRRSSSAVEIGNPALLRC